MGTSPLHSNNSIRVLIFPASPKIFFTNVKKVYNVRRGCNMKYKLAIFDLDGTILNTLEDLKNALNAALREFNYAERTLAEVCAFVGNGVTKLVLRALPKDANNADAVVKRFREIYADNMDVMTKPYDGIIDLIKTLRERGMIVGVSSNKFDSAVKMLCNEYFGDLIDYAVGECAETPAKPDPSGARLIMKNAGASESETVYIGDSDVDVQTAKNACVDMIGVAWGFRGKTALIEAGAKRVAETADELLVWLTE